MGSGTRLWATVHDLYGNGRQIHLVLYSACEHMCPARSIIIKIPVDKTGTSIRASALTLTGTALNRCRRVQKSPRERLKTIPEVGSEKLITLTF